MDIATKKTPTVNPAFTLSARQEQLLFAALNSNPKQAPDSSPVQKNGIFSMTPASFSESPVQAPGSGTMNGFEDSPFDYDNEFDFEADGSFDYGLDNGSQGQMIGKLPGTSLDGDVDTHDKRNHEDDEDEEDGGGKRREGDERSSKKPGRKPLTSEPTSKRKAQNRAAQRAFRERKEKHLKDLETKVDDLQQASESANHENSILRAQIEKMSVELREYKKRLSAGSGVVIRSSSLNTKYPAYMAGQGFRGHGLNDPNDVNFSFEFPKFGRFPTPPTNGLGNGGRHSTSPVTANQSIVSSVERGVSPHSQRLQFATPSGSVSNASLTRTPALVDNGDMSSLSGLFSPSILDSVGKSPGYDFFANRNNGSSSSTDSANSNANTSHHTSYSSPSASSTSHHGGPNSSCGTSPEPSMQSPGASKAMDSTLTTIGEERSGDAIGEGELSFCDKLNMACGNSKNPIPRTMSESSANQGNNAVQNPSSVDINGIDWFAQQNDNQFDPQLFGDYREPQHNILATDFGGDSFFSDAFAIPDFSTPYNVDPSPQPERKDLLQQLDEYQSEDNEVVPAEDTSKLLSCNTIWDRLQACPKVKEGDFDLDSLCKDLQKKAQCSETGAVVNESDFHKILQRYDDEKIVKKVETE